MYMAKFVSVIRSVPDDGNRNNLWNIAGLLCIVVADCLNISSYFVTMKMSGFVCAVVVNTFHFCYRWQ